MKQVSHMPIREFSRLTGIRRENLRFYDQIGLLSPELRGENGYRYYTRRQLEAAFLISDLRALGLSLEEIRHYAANRSPQGMLALFQEQDAHVEAEIKRLRSIQELMRLRADMAIQALSQKEGTLRLEEREAEPLYLCPPLLQDSSEEDGIVDAYDHAAEVGIDVSFPLGTVVTKDTLTAGGPPRAFCYYFKVKRLANAQKPAGLYGVFYGRYSQNATVEVYDRLRVLLREQGLRAGGDCYEEYLLDELSVNEGERYGVRVEVRVEQEGRKSRA